ncbi:MAG: hypothetical protein M1529_06365 [Candidatus Thermoplasmatota archaeon]|nr:hypothetical protein [Candidatus Thermoplasmatota archaeon]
MHGSLRIYRSDSFDPGYVDRFHISTRDTDSIFHFLISDGIMVDFRSAFMPETLESMRIQRILTSYQLQKILMESDDYPYFIAVMSHAISDWKTTILQSILDVLRIKTYYRGCRIELNIIGERDIHELYIGNMTVARRKTVREAGIFRWDEQY